jgi:hypothetical protein
MSRRLLVALASVAIASLGMLPVSGAAQAPSGVPNTFAPCLGGGYQTLVRSDGTSFANLGACVSFAVRGGTLFRALNASSVYTPQRGSGGTWTAPDANGNSFGGQRDGGPITGAFNGGMGWQFDFVLHTTTGVVDGTGTASCDPCSVAGLTGTVSFSLTESGHGSLVSCDPFLCAAIAIDGGTWQITSATGNLAAISGSGSWTQDANGSRVMSGSVLSPV